MKRRTFLHLLGMAVPALTTLAHVDAAELQAVDVVTPDRWLTTGTWLPPGPVSSTLPWTPLVAAPLTPETTTISVAGLHTLTQRVAQAMARELGGRIRTVESKAAQGGFYDKDHIVQRTSSPPPALPDDHLDAMLNGDIGREMRQMRIIGKLGSLYGMLGHSAAVRWGEQISSGQLDDWGGQLGQKVRADGCEHIGLPALPWGVMASSQFLLPDAAAVRGMMMYDAAADAMLYRFDTAGSYRYPALST